MAIRSSDSSSEGQMALVRVANALDPLPLTALRTASWRAAYRGILPPGYLARLGGGLHLFPPGTWVAEREGEPVGYLASDGGHPSAREPAPSRVEVLELYIDPDRWRAGVGTALVEAAAESLHSRGAEVLFLWVLEANLGARRFYEAIGFAGPLERKRVGTGEGSLPALLYRRSLP